MAVINYIMSLGVSVMMPIIFLILGLLIGMGFGKSLVSGLKVGGRLCWLKRYYSITFR